MLYKPDWEETTARFTDWWNHTAEEAIIQVTAPKEGGNPTWFDAWGFASRKQPTEELLGDLDRWAAGVRWAGESYPNCWLNLGPGCLATYYTGYLHFDERGSTVWFEQPREWEEVDKLAFQPDGEWYQYTLEAARKASVAGEGRFVVGNTDIGGLLDVLASFRGTQDLLMDLVLEPERIHAWIPELEASWWRVYSEIDAIIAERQQGSSAWMGLWCPGRWYPLQCDFSAMISPAQFDEFVAPSLARQCAQLDYSVYHWDGPGQLGFLDSLLAIDDLDAIQWVPGDGNPMCEAEQWYPMLSAHPRGGQGPHPAMLERPRRRARGAQETPPRGRSSSPPGPPAKPKPTSC